MKQAAIKLMCYFNRNGELDQEQQQVYVYGINILIEIAFSVIITLAVAFKLGLMKEVAVVYIVTLLIRSYGGGLHLKEFYSCLVISVGFIVLILLLYKYVPIKEQLLLAAFWIAVIYIFIKGLSKDQHRTYHAMEEKYYNLMIRIIALFLCVLVNIFRLLGWHHFFKLISITVIILAVIKLGGEFCDRQNRKTEEENS